MLVFMQQTTVRSNLVVKQQCYLLLRSKHKGRETSQTPMRILFLSFGSCTALAVIDQRLNM